MTFDEASNYFKGIFEENAQLKRQIEEQQKDIKELEDKYDQLQRLADHARKITDEQVKRLDKVLTRQ